MFNTLRRSIVAILILSILYLALACASNTTLVSNQPNLTSQPSSSNGTTTMPTNASSTAPSVVTFFEGSRIKSTFEEDITFSDACVIGRIISSTIDPDQTIDCLFQIDEVIYGDIKGKTIHVHQLPNPELSIDTTKK